MKLKLRSYSVCNLTLYRQTKRGKLVPVNNLKEAKRLVAQANLAVLYAKPSKEPSE